MRRLVPPLALVLVLMAAPAAHAGGWATVSLDQPLGDPRAGEPWTVNVEVLQHGVTPMTGVTPSVRIIRGDEQHDFAASPTGKAGMYTATLRFPSEGRWSYRVFDGFTDVEPHLFPAVTVAPSTAGAALPAERPDEGLPWPQLLALLGIALLGVAGWAFGTRPERPRRRPEVPLAR
jgi:hypothetical protein